MAIENRDLIEMKLKQYEPFIHMKELTKTIYLNNYLRQEQLLINDFSDSTNNPGGGFGSRSNATRLLVWFATLVSSSIS